MTEKKSSSPSCGKHIPEETRQHLKAARAEMLKSMEALLPPGFLEHRHAARREMLMAARSLIDAAIHHYD